MFINKKNAPLLIGLAIPFLMILFVAVSIYMPGLFVHPAYDFVYAQGDNEVYYDGRNYQAFTVENGTLHRNTVSAQTGSSTINGKPIPSVVPILYYYDIRQNVSREITFEDAAKLRLDRGPISPDGFEIVQGGYGGDFPFFFGGRDYNERYIKGRNVSRKLNINTSSSSYYPYYNFQLLGWVLSPVSHE